MGGFGHFGAEYNTFGSSNSKNSNHGLYLVYEQEIAEDSTLFLRMGWSPNEDINPVNNYFEVGYTHPYQMTEKIHSKVGIAFTHTSFSSDFINAEGFDSNSESVIEISNPISLLENTTLQPDFQIIFNPLESNATAYVAGIRLIIGI